MQALNSAFNELLLQDVSSYQYAWSPFLLTQYTPPPLYDVDDKNTCSRYGNISYPSQEQATGTFKRILDKEEITFGTYSEQPPFSYFVNQER